MMDDSSARMIDNHGPVVHQAISVVLSLGYVWSKRVRKRMKLDRVGQDCANLRVKVGIAEGIVVLVCRMLVEHLPMFWRERDGAAIMMMLRRCHARCGQDRGGNA